MVDASGRQLPRPIAMNTRPPAQVRLRRPDVGQGRGTAQGAGQVTVVADGLGSPPTAQGPASQPGRPRSRSAPADRALQGPEDALHIVVRTGHVHGLSPSPEPYGELTVPLAQMPGAASKVFGRLGAEPSGVVDRAEEELLGQVQRRNTVV